ncbi:MAG: hypothetical protein US25_C0060G0002 [Candidatus Moranbacteria bacterium GW2011_GWE1_36_7]|nr:MAG: hypothetical protein UR99_C0004G0022 [Candidatus Moranbacteria bacterium GW2011_GWD2_36_12]KKQ06932.1 MAG: hypothetical protein US16_C0006G0022 [Candidatus Moranbacteria bacterium GW2011_GWE2_36_40]KKQ12210.1 MAG: hypothetical protein US25_C0060G0002 [Candidatus Moranbacteria bacterium GW2011_GWE1_36_7]
MFSKHKRNIFAFFILFFFILPIIPVQGSVSDDANYYEKYPLYEKYEKKKKYDKYQRAKEKYGFKNSAQREKYRKAYEKFRLFKKSPTKYPQYAGFLKEYRKYKKYKEEVSPLKKYARYERYDKKEYERYKGYGSSTYKDGYNRYKAFISDINNVTTNRGPEIKVGLWSYSKDDLIASPFKITASKPFDITDCNSTKINIDPIAIGENARVTYLGPDGILQAYNSNIPALFPTTSNQDKFCFVASDGNNDDMLFDVNKPDSTYDQYRGKITIQHSYTDDNQDQEGDLRRIWVINSLPLEHYVWGFGEIGGGVEQHSKAMIVAARTYARWYLQPTVTKWNEEGFNVLSTSGSQIYRGYDYEKDHATIPDLAKKTNGIIMKNQDNDIVLAAYSSWTDGRTRKYEDGLFGGSCASATAGDTSSLYPELSAVADPYGKNSSLDTCALGAAGNHMVGMSANGSLNLAANYGWSWTKILSYYYSRISIVKEY